MTVDFTSEFNARRRSASAPGDKAQNSHVPFPILLWRRLRRGMSADEVRAIFGSPVESHQTAEDEIWRYVCDPSVMDLTLIFRSGLLARWTEPIPSLYMPGKRQAELLPA